MIGLLVRAEAGVDEIAAERPSRAAVVRARRRRRDRRPAAHAPRAPPTGGAARSGRWRRRWSARSTTRGAPATTARSRRSRSGWDSPRSSARCRSSRPAAGSTAARRDGAARAPREGLLLVCSGLVAAMAGDFEEARRRSTERQELLDSLDRRSARPRSPRGRAASSCSPAMLWRPSASCGPRRFARGAGRTREPRLGHGAARRGARAPGAARGGARGCSDERAGRLSGRRPCSDRVAGGTSESAGEPRSRRGGRARRAGGGRARRRHGFALVRGRRAPRRLRPPTPPAEPRPRPQRRRSRRCGSTRRRATSSPRARRAYAHGVAIGGTYTVDAVLSAEAVSAPSPTRTTCGVNPRDRGRLVDDELVLRRVRLEQRVDQLRQRRRELRQGVVLLADDADLPEHERGPRLHDGPPAEEVVRLVGLEAVLRRIDAEIGEQAVQRRRRPGASARRDPRLRALRTASRAGKTSMPGGRRRPRRRACPRAQAPGSSRPCARRRPGGSGRPRSSPRASGPRVRALEHDVLAHGVADEEEDLVCGCNLRSRLRRQLRGADAGADDDERSGHMHRQTMMQRLAYEPGWRGCAPRCPSACRPSSELITFRGCSPSCLSIELGASDVFACRLPLARDRSTRAVPPGPRAAE